MMRLIFAFLLLVLPRVAAAGDVAIAVASNFLTTAEELARKFEEDTGHAVTISHGATGQLFTQIDAGAPFDVFLAADAKRPELLVQSGKASEAATYALGKLVLAGSTDITRDSASDVIDGRTVALADPTVAPYGLASTAAMERLKLDTATFRPVLVANVGQVATVFASGNADFAFVSAAQVPLLNPAAVLELNGLHPPITQDAALLTQASDNDAAAAFWEWLFSDDATSLIARSGYDLPE